ncbi:MAG: asparagine synthase (glutamine-hydrolyzing) [Chthoniobacterales bacterium]|nr:asparagine synthase (glutamine-hydrolyzing) [Chthoniobacterales bacterium]
MCGIAGWFGSGGHWDANVLRDGLSRRGPDGSGIWRSDKATLVHTRLAVIGLGERGAQPMSRAPRNGDDASDSVLVFNGEIYNYRELGRSDAESDTAVLLELLDLEGEACLPRLAGMFAFAFYRPSAGEALLARDAFGIKPLYYRIDGDNLAFASEARLLRRPGDEPDAGALRDFFLWGSVPEPATVAREVRQVPAGHFLRWKNGRAEVVRWHKPDLRRHRTMPRDEAVRRTRGALEETMLRHLVSDVPVGVFLSGGIDSTTVLALARQQLGPKAELRTFSIGFEDPEFDESAVARRTAEHFGALHTEWRMTPGEGAEEIREYLATIDQPTIDGFNSWCVSKLARREGIKVVLSGLGGDEWFAGYGSFARVPQLHFLHGVLPARVRRFVAACCGNATAGSPRRRLCAFLRGEGSWLQAFHAMRGIFTSEEAEELAGHFAGTRPPPPEWSEEFLPATGPEIAGWMEVTRYMRNQLLRDSDVFSMAQGIELRVPFVDARLADALLELPPGYRLEKGKQLLLDAVPEIPEWVRNRPKKGFVFPFSRWMENVFAEMLEEAQKASPVPLVTWYRIWAAAVGSRAVGNFGRAA